MASKFIIIVGFLALLSATPVQAQEQTFSDELVYAKLAEISALLEQPAAQKGWGCKVIANINDETAEFFVQTLSDCGKQYFSTDATIVTYRTFSAATH